MSTPSFTRLNKYISEQGICSRREADKLIELGRVFLNGSRAILGAHVKPGDKVMVNGQKLDQVEGKTLILLALNKPVGITSTTETTTKDNIVDFVNHSERVFPIGRLDKDSQGLILLTNNGDIVNKILRAGNKHEKEYLVTVNKPINNEFIDGMANGVPIMGEMTKKCKVIQESTFVFRIVLIQGKNRQIRRMCEHFNYEVTKLERVRIMNITLKGLPLGDWRELTEEETATILKSMENSSSEPKSPRAGKRPRKEAAEGDYKKHATMRANRNHEEEDDTDTDRKTNTRESDDFVRGDDNEGGFETRKKSKPSRDEAIDDGYDNENKPGKAKKTFGEWRAEGKRKSDDGGGRSGDRSDRPRKSFSDDDSSRERKPWTDRKSEGGRRSDSESKPWSDRKSEGGRRSEDGRKPYGDRKSGSDSKPWSERKSEGGRRSEGESKPWSDRKSEGRPRSEDGRKPYGDRKSEGGSKPWSDRKSDGGRRSDDGKKSYGDRKSEGGSKPWSDRKSGGDSKPWSDRKSEGGRRSDDGKKSYGDRKSEGGSKPWSDRKSGGDSKPWSDRKSEGRSFGKGKPGAKSSPRSGGKKFGGGGASKGRSSR
jgi:23S rRNA pseudouridine2604 synthase